MQDLLSEVKLTVGEISRDLTELVHTFRWVTRLHFGHICSEVRSMRRVADSYHLITTKYQFSDELSRDLGYSSSVYGWRVQVKFVLEFLCRDESQHHRLRPFVHIASVQAYCARNWFMSQYPATSCMRDAHKHWARTSLRLLLALMSSACACSFSYSEKRSYQRWSTNVGKFVRIPQSISLSGNKKRWKFERLALLAALSLFLFFVNPRNSVTSLTLDIMWCSFPFTERSCYFL